MEGGSAVVVACLHFTHLAMLVSVWASGGIVCIGVGVNLTINGAVTFGGSGDSMGN